MISVLYVDDEPDLLEIGRIFLERDGTFSVDTVTSAPEALVRMETKTYNAIIADYHMPEMSGIEFLRIVREEYGHIPFILFTGRGREEVVIEALNIGADFYLQKGGDVKAQFAELVHKVRVAVSRREAEEELRITIDRLHMAQKIGKVGSWELDLVTSEIWGSEEAFHIFGYTFPAGTVSRDVIESRFVDRDRVVQTATEMVRNRGIYDLVYAISPADGTPVKHLHSVARLIFNPEGKLVKLSGVVKDITEQVMVAEALRESEEKYRVLLDESSDPIFSFYPDGTYRYVNRAFAEGVGKTVPEINGRKIHDIFPPDEAEKRFSAMRGVFTTGQMKEIEVRVPRTDGDRYYLTTITPIRDSSGTVISVICSSKEITARKQAELALANRVVFQQALIDSIPHPVFIKDASGKFMGCNRAYEREFNTTRDYMIGKTVLDLEYLLPGERERFQKEDLQVIAEGSRLSYELPIILADGQTHITLYSVDGFRLADGRPGGLIGMLVDISDQKNLENALKGVNRQLNLLTSITRHDINNKITAINGFIGLLLEKNMESASRSYIERIAAAVQAIESQIAFTKVYQDLGTREPRWQALESVISGLLVPDTLHLVHKVHGIRVFADPMLERVFFNLLDNTLRHGGPVTQVRVSAVAGRSDSLVIVWEDNGIGIPPEEKERIFERGFGKNTGLGLFLVREVLGISGITIAETGIPGQGARFEIVVPNGMYRRDMA